MPTRECVNLQMDYEVGDGFVKYHDIEYKTQLEALDMEVEQEQKYPQLGV